MILCQNEDDKEVIACLKEDHLGKCSEASLAFITSLSHDLAEDVEASSVHIF